jgi:hypothetical protein
LFEKRFQHVILKKGASFTLINGAKPKQKKGASSTLMFYQFLELCAKTNVLLVL